MTERSIDELQIQGDIYITLGKTRDTVFEPMKQYDTSTRLIAANNINTVHEMIDKWNKHWYYQKRDGKVITRIIKIDAEKGSVQYVE